MRVTIDIDGRSLAWKQIKDQLKYFKIEWGDDDVGESKDDTGKQTKKS